MRRAANARLHLERIAAAYAPAALSASLGAEDMVRKSGSEPDFLQRN